MYQIIGSNNHQITLNAHPWLWLLPLIIVWDLAWRGVALWKAARNDQPAWFVALIIFNTVGLLPIIYLLFFQRRKPQA